MSRILIIAGFVGLTACGSDSEPAWALDPVYIEPSDSGITGFQTWEFFGERWSKGRSGKHYLCTVIVGLTGSPANCQPCVTAWDIETSLVESDCPSKITDGPLPLSLVGLGIGELAAEGDPPYPEQTSESWADYGMGWERHGWAYPDGLDHGHSSTSTHWDGTEAYTLWPTSAWPL